ncbi:Calcium-dependent protein kinase [Balamuthia mandrillaris]
MEKTQLTAFLSAELQQRVKQVFDRFDTDGTGSFTAERLGECLAALGYNFTDKALKIFVKLVDANGNGAVEFSEFLPLFGYLVVMDMAFDALDDNKSGSFDRKQLGIALEQLGYKFSKKQVQALFVMADQDDSGEVEKAEFQTLALFLQYCLVLFNYYDKDNNGTIEFDEFRPLLSQLEPDYDDIDTAKMLFDSTDMDGNGELDFAEVVKLVFLIKYSEDN